MHANSVGEHGDETWFLFSKRIRRLSFYAGLFVLYSQLVSAGLTGIYRYSPWEKTWMDGGDPPIFDYWTVTLLQPPERIGTSADWLAVGRNVGGSPFCMPLGLSFLRFRAQQHSSLQAGPEGVGVRDLCFSSEAS